MSNRLSTCDTWHPDSPARLAVQKAGRDKAGNYRHKTACLECQRLKTAESRCHGPYGVLPRLMWTAPEFIT